jgi:hypothetical protein
MGFRIEDGKGRGKFASVNERNLLNVAAVTTPIISNASKLGDAYSVFGEHTIQAADTDENVLFLRNDKSNVDVYLQSLRLSCKTSTGVIVKNYFNTTYTSGGTTRTSVQLNRGSAKTSGMFCRDNASNNLVVTTTTLEEFTRFRMGLTTTILAISEGALILGPGDGYLTRCQGAIGDIVNENIFFFEVERTSY